VSSQPPNNPSEASTIQPTKADFVALTLIGLIALAFVWPLFVPGWIIPQGGGDLLSFLWPTYRYAAKHLNLQSLITDNQSLLWNPTLYSGAPFAADNQTGLFYPPNLFTFLLFPALPYAVLEALVALHLFIAGAGMYLFMRFEAERLKIGDWRLEIGIFPAIAFMASDVFITHLGNYNIVAASSWLPLILLCLRQSLISNLQSLTSNLRWSIAAGLLLGFAALAGHAQMTFIIALACAVYGLYELIVQRHYRVLLLGALSALVAFGLAALALLPALELLGYTARSALDYGEASRWSLPPLGLAGMISPLVFGRGAGGWWPSWDRVEVGYMGLTALVVVLQLRNLKCWPFGIWLLGFGIFSLFIAFGKYTPIHGLLFQYVPGFSSLRVPARFILLTNFALAALSGFVLATTREPGSRPFAKDAQGDRVKFLSIKAQRLGFGHLGFGIFLALFAPLTFGRPLAWSAFVISIALLAATLVLLIRAPRWLPLLLFAELFAFGGFVEVDRADPEAQFKRGPAVEWLLAQPGPTRIDVATSKWQPDSPAVFGLEAIYGVSNPLALAHYDRYYWSVGYRGSPQYNFLNAQFVVADKDSPPADSTFVPVFNEDPEVDVYLNTNAMPRPHLIYDPIFVDSADSAFAAIHSPTFNPASQVVLEANPKSQIPTTNLQSSVFSNLFYATYRPGHFAIVAQTPESAYLVLAEVWYPGWRATINGQPADIIRANTAFMAVQIPSGENTVTFTFTSPLLMIGAIITAITLVASLALLFWPRR
jgi:hypothetical protein